MESAEVKLEHTFYNNIVPALITIKQKHTASGDFMLGLRNPTSLFLQRATLRTLRRGGCFVW